MPLCPYDAKILGSAIKKARNKKHLTQTKCAKLLGYSLSFQKDVERGRFSPSLENFYRICRTLNVSADECIFYDMNSE
ncbi:helix-turn-helix domain-containing protein [Eisenbergiella sp.]